ncbi:hypothetical protein [Bradyrhizobium genosp. A]|uniref:hypothetical protein n=1 Tax=Bradyrhizobium genosp. A TaxID=83626 RepID=UPI003CF738CB
MDLVGIVDPRTSARPGDRYSLPHRMASKSFQKVRASVSGWNGAVVTHSSRICKILVGCDLPSRKTCTCRSGEDFMNGNLAQFGADLRLDLSRLQASLNNIDGLFAHGVIADDAEFASRLQELQATVTGDSERAAELDDALQDGLARDAARAPETVARWVGTRQTAQLHARADLIEQLAITAVELAALYTLQAERITMTAIVARRQAVTVQVQRAGQP